MRACWMFGQLYYLEFKDKAHVTKSVQGISRCLFDEHLTVKLEAAVALAQVADGAKELIAPELGKIIQVYLQLMNEIDSEDLVDALAVIMETFKEEIVPYALDTIKSLVSQHIKLTERI